MYFPCLAVFSVFACKEHKQMNLVLVLFDSKFVLLSKYCWKHQVKEEEMAVAYVILGGEERCGQSYGRIILK
jgi:hypothetical protein